MDLSPDLAVAAGSNLQGIDCKVTLVSHGIDFAHIFLRTRGSFTLSDRWISSLNHVVTL